MKNDNIQILIIDDEEAIRDSCSIVLQKQGFDVQTAVDGIQGLKLLKQEVFHAVLLDLKLPGMEGKEVISRIKADKRQRRMPDELPQNYFCC